MLSVVQTCVLPISAGGEASTKKCHAFLREPKAVKFAFVHSWRHRWPVELLCRVMLVSERGYRSWRSRPISRRERTDMKVLAHIRRSEEHTSELQSLMRISYAVFCLKKTKKTQTSTTTH